MNAVTIYPDVHPPVTLPVLRRTSTVVVVHWPDGPTDYLDEFGNATVPVQWLQPRLTPSRTMWRKGQQPTYERVVELRAEGLEPEQIRDRLGITEMQYFAAVGHASRRGLL